MRQKDIKVGQWYMLDSKYPQGPDGPIPVYVWEIISQVKYSQLPYPGCPGPVHTCWYHSLEWFAEHCLHRLKFEFKKI